jgi:hypothetical protein
MSGRGSAGGVEAGRLGDARVAAGVAAVGGSRLDDEERFDRRAAAGRRATGGIVGHISRLVAQGRERLVAGLLVAFAAAFNLYHLYPEVAIEVPSLNDWNLHLVGLRGALAALAAGHDPTDPWIGTITLGFPLFHHYQHLAYLPPALLIHLLSLAGGQGIDLVDVLSRTSYLLLSLFPLSVFWSLRRFGFSSMPAALAGLAPSLVATNGLYGFDFSSYVWRGSGLYTQLWGMVLLPLALA